MAQEKITTYDYENGVMKNNNHTQFIVGLTIVVVTGV